MSGTRLQTKSTPIVNRLPQWSVKNYYDKNHIICQVDSDNINVYVCIKSHIPNDSDLSLFVLDSETNLPRLNISLWAHYLTTEILDSEERSPAAINQRIKRYQFTIDSDNQNLDSDLLVLQGFIPLEFDSETIDSDLKIARQDILFLSTETILNRFIDSDARHKEIIVWDSDSQIYKTKPTMLTFNTFGPDSNGNIPLTITKVISGDKDNRPDSDINGTVYIIAGDSDSDAIGNSFIFDNGIWVSFISPDKEINDNKFLRIGGQNNMVGKLYVGQPFATNEIANKLYVDSILKEKKQSAFGYFDSDLLIDTSIFDSENFVVTRENPSLWFYDEINTTVIGNFETYLTSFINASVISPNVIQFTVRHFSNELGGTLEVLKNGNLEPFTADSDNNNVAASSIVTGIATDMKLASVSSQQFTLNFTNPYSVTDKYIIKYIMHDGDVATLTKDSDSSTWYPNLENFDFGTY